MQGWRSGKGMPLLTLSPEFNSRKRCHVRGLVRISPKVRTVFQISLRSLIGLSALNGSTPGWGLTLTFSSYPWRLTKISFTPENFHNIWVFPLKNIRRLPVKNMGLPLKNFVAPQLGGGGGWGLRILKAIPHLERSFTLKTLVIYEAVFGSSSNAPPGFLLWGGTLHEDKKRLGSRRRQSDPAEYQVALLPSIYLSFFFVA